MTPSTELPLAESIAVAPGNVAASPSNGSVAAAPRTNNTLKLKERVALMTWMETAENRKLVADDSDANAAAQATATLGFDVTPANIMSIRRVLGIEKTKPAAPPADLDLVTLHEKVQAIGIEVEKIKADGTDATIALLKNRVNWLIEVIANNFHILAGVGTPPAPIA
jgi:hypothetical protein